MAKVRKKVIDEEALLGKIVRDSKICMKYLM